MAEICGKEKDEFKHPQWIVPFVEEDLKNCLKSATKVSLWLKAHLKLFGKKDVTRGQTNSSSIQQGTLFKEPSDDFVHAVLSTRLSELK